MYTSTQLLNLFEKHKNNLSEEKITPYSMFLCGFGEGLDENPGECQYCEFHREYYIDDLVWCVKLQQTFDKNGYCTKFK